MAKYKVIHIGKLWINIDTRIYYGIIFTLIVLFILIIFLFFKAIKS